MTATVEGRRVSVGGIAYAAARADLAEGDGEAADNLRRLRDGTGVVVAVSVDGRLAGGFLMVDELRAGSHALLDALRAEGLKRIVLATGDRAGVAEALAADLPVDEIRSEQTPADKVAVVVAERRHGAVMMVGDGVNDAPALAAADIGLAMGATGSAAAAETADVVLLVDQLSRLREALVIARRARTIALQSVVAGIGLSLVAMVAAAFGLSRRSRARCCRRPSTSR